MCHVASTSARKDTFKIMLDMLAFLLKNKLKLLSLFVSLLVSMQDEKGMSLGWFV